MNSNPNPVAKVLQGTGTRPAVSMKDFFRDLAKDYDTVMKPHRLRRFITWANCDLYFRGRQLIWFNPTSNRVEPIPADKYDLDLYFINNIILPFVEMLASEYSKSRPKLEPWSYAGDDRHVAGALDNARYWIDCQLDSLVNLTPLDQQREVKLALTRASVFTKTTWNPELGPPSQMGVPTGDVEFCAIDPFEVEIWDRVPTVELSPYLKHEWIELKSKVMDEFGLEDIGPGQQDGLVFTGLLFKRQLELAVGNTGEADANASLIWGGMSYVGDPSNLEDKLVCRKGEIYFDRAAYAHWKTMLDDEVLPGMPQPVPKGTPLKEIFDQGLKITTVNGEQILFENVKKNDVWSGYPFIVAPTGPYGIGVENMLAQQDWFNETVSILTASAVYASAGIGVYDSNRIQGPFKMRPGEWLPVEDVMPGERLDTLFAHFTGSGVDSNLVNLPEFIKESMQFTSLARNAQVSGAPGQGTNTATGVANMAATSDMFAGTKTELRAWNLARRCEQGLKLFQQHSVYPRLFTRLGEIKGKWLRNVDIGTEIHIRVEPDSHTPRTTRDRQNDFLAAVNAGVGNPQMMTPQMSDYGTKIFNLPTSINPATDWEVIGQDRIDRMVGALPAIMNVSAQAGIPDDQAGPFLAQELVRVVLPKPQQTPPDQVAMGAPPETIAPDVLDDDQALMKFYEDYYRSDYYKELPPPIQDAIHLLYSLHKHAIVAKQTEVAQMQIDSSQPVEDKQRQMMMEQQEMQKGQQDQESAADEQQEAQGRTHDVIMKSADQEEADKSREHEQQMAAFQSKESDREHKRKMELAKVQARNKVQAAKKKPTK